MTIGIGLPVAEPARLTEWAVRAERGGFSTVGLLEQVRAAVADYTDAGADEVMFYCWASDPDQVERLAEAL